MFTLIVVCSCVYNSITDWITRNYINSNREADTMSQVHDTVDLVEQFCSVTGSDKTTATNLLEACNYDLEMAVNLHMENSPACSSDDYVRPPIAPVQEVLVQPTENTRALRGKRRVAHSVQDGFRDFREEAKYQEMLLSKHEEMMANPSHVKKRKTLEDLFRPPVDLTFKGSFQKAREDGASQKKWLLVNIQNSKEFSCQVLNRDVWSNAQVKSIIREHFVFWQVYMDSDDGQQYATFYKVHRWPYIAVLDPRTGENLRTWQNIDALSFCEVVTDFLNCYTFSDDFESSDNHNDEKKEALSENALQNTEKVIRNCSGVISPPKEKEVQTATKIEKTEIKNTANDEVIYAVDETTLSTDTNICTLMLRYPDNCRKKVVFSSKSKLQDLTDHVTKQGFQKEDYELVTNFPRTILSNLDQTSTLAEIGLCPQETVFIQSRS